MANGMTKVRIRMYRQGLGDCFLLTLYTGPDPVHMLVDCGTLGATTTSVKMQDVVNDIASETGGHIHLLVVTHEHKDHVSGFLSQQETFDAFKVDRVWVAWTENPKDELAQEVVKFKGDLLSSLALASDTLLTARPSLEKETLALHELASGVRELLRFYGDIPPDDAPLAADFAKTVNEAMNYACRLSGGPPDFMKPGSVIELVWLPGVRFYVFGPPRSETALAMLGEYDSPELYHLVKHLCVDLGRNVRFFASNQSVMRHIGELDAEARQQIEVGLAFDLRFRIASDNAPARARYLQAYDDPQMAWRCIDYDWLTTVSGLALQLDNMTNNTCLVLAVELIDDGRVLLLPGDAQLGNWMSWKDLEFSVTEADGTPRIIKAVDLLKRTAFYKVGHHASHNATLNEPGLETMQRDDLVAMIPVDRQVAQNKTPPWQMPAEALYERLLEKTRGRVLRSDTGWPNDSDRPLLVSQAEWDAARADENIRIEDLYIEYRLA